MAAEKRETMLVSYNINDRRLIALTMTPASASRRPKAAFTPRDSARRRVGTARGTVITIKYIQQSDGFLDGSGVAQRPSLECVASVSL